MKNTLRNIAKNLSNIQGWSTNRKIVVFEVDDWGAIRTRDREARDRMALHGLDLKKNRFGYYDSLANAKDLEGLFEVLSKYKDKNGRPAQFTAVAVVANPDFEKIRQSSFQEYHYEPFDQTLKRYYPGEDVLGIWKQGMEARLFHPEFHGREHLNPELWLDALQSGDQKVRIAFDNESLGVKSPAVSNYTGGYLSAFDFKDMSHRDRQEQVISEGLALFEDIFGYKAKHFTSSGLIHHPEIERYLAGYGIKFVDIAKKNIQPEGNGNYSKKMYKLGQKNKWDQYYITRNSRFEPNDSSSKDWVNQTVKDIEIAFRWNKPAIISSHRVNYVGAIDPANRENGLRQLDELLKKITARWPEAEFMSVTELGELML